ncbi:MAG: tetratricopeptide repeat protein [Candidatus Hydrogenedentes bacterium]|nr:tetratricopeptide repeat protein [Candidatus Hydrogenedentota bacterium]
MKRFIAATLAVLSIAAPARADFEAGREAFEKGDFTKAPNEFLSSVMEGNTGAQFYLDLMYEKGAGVPQGTAKAFKWYNLAAEQGSPEAMFKLGVYHYDGSGGAAKDAEKAMAWFGDAAGLGIAGAQFNIGLMHAKGLGAERDYALAAKWFRLAAKQNHALAQHGLGINYAKGLGVERDLVRASMWSQLTLKAVKPGPTRTAIKEARDDIARLLTADQLDRVQAMIEKWSAERGF